MTLGFIFILFFSSILAVGTVSADTPESEVIFQIVQIDDSTVEQREAVREWLNSNKTDEFPSLAEDAREWLNSYEDQQEEANRNLSGTKTISDNVRVTGYKFSRSNESVTFAIEVDEPTNIVIQDIGEITGGGSYEYTSQEYPAGYHRIEMTAESARIGGSYMQRIAIADTDLKQGNTISNQGGLFNIFNQIESWMIPLAGLSGSVTVLIIIIRKVRSIDKKGINEFIPLR